MLLKLGATMMAAVLAVAAGVALAVSFRAPETSAVASYATVPETTVAAPNNDFDSYEGFSRKNSEPEPDPDLKLRPEAEPPAERERASRSERVAEQGRAAEPEIESESRQDERVAEGEEVRVPDEGALASGEERFPVPDEDEIAQLDEPRRFAPDPGANLTLSLPSLGVRNAPVYDSDSEQALANGVAHVPETSMPWDRGAQRNVYLAAHRLGYPGSGSRLLFYELDQLGRGDEVVLKGRGRTYRYKVSETLVVDPGDSRVMGQMIGRDIVTLQTCTPIPTYEKRLVVRADRVG